MTDEVESFPNETPTMTISGNSFFFCGNATSFGKAPHVVGGENGIAYDHVDGDVITEYIVLGPDGQFFRCARPRTGNIAAMNNSDLDQYHNLTFWLGDHDVERPAFLSLGPSGTFYIRAEDNSEKWFLPSEIIQHVLDPAIRDPSRTLQSLWLGYNGTYVAQYTDKQLVFDLKGMYSGLGHALQRQGQGRQGRRRIAALALDVQGTEGYVMVWENQSLSFGSGVVHEQQLVEWAARNFRRRDAS